MHISHTIATCSRRALVLTAGAAVAIGGIAPGVAIAATATGGALPTVEEFRTGTISGTVKTPSGKPAKGIWLSAVKGNNSNAWFETNSKGKFARQAWLTKTVKAKLAVNRFSGESRYVGGYWAGNGKKITTSYSKAKTITLAKNRSVTGIKPVLATCATVSGTAKNGDQYTTVAVFNDANKSLVTRSDISIGKTGKFTVRGLQKGKYYMAAVQYNGDSQIESFYGTKSGKKPAKPNLVIKSCTNIKNANFKAKKVVTPKKWPVIKGTPKAGHKLMSTAGTYSKKGVKLSYQWYRKTWPEGAGRLRVVKLPGATSKYYTVKAADKGSWLEVRVVAKKSGYRSAVTTATKVVDES